MYSIVAFQNAPTALTAIALLHESVRATSDSVGTMQLSFAAQFARRIASTDSVLRQTNVNVKKDTNSIRIQKTLLTAFRFAKIAKTVNVRPPRPVAAIKAMFGTRKHCSAIQSVIKAVLWTHAAIQTNANFLMESH